MQIFLVHQDTHETYTLEYSETKSLTEILADAQLPDYDLNNYLPRIPNSIVFTQIGESLLAEAMYEIIMYSPFNLMADKIPDVIVAFYVMKHIHADQYAQLQAWSQANPDIKDIMDIIMEAFNPPLPQLLYIVNILGINSGDYGVNEDNVAADNLIDDDDPMEG